MGGFGISTVHERTLVLFLPFDNKLYVSRFRAPQSTTSAFRHFKKMLELDGP